MAIKSRENLIGAWAFLFGVVLAVILGLSVGLSGSQNYKINAGFLGILALLGITVGYFVAQKNIKTFLIAAVSVVIVSFAGIQGLVMSAAIGGGDISKVMISILGALLFLFIPAAIIVSIKTAFSIASE